VKAVGTDIFGFFAGSPTVGIKTDKNLSDRVKDLKIRIFMTFLATNTNNLIQYCDSIRCNV
jgi:hypothetical protein